MTSMMAMGRTMTSMMALDIHVESVTSSPGCNDINGGIGPMTRLFCCRRWSQVHHSTLMATSVDMCLAFAVTPQQVLALCQSYPCDTVLGGPMVTCNPDCFHADLRGGGTVLTFKICR